METNNTQNKKASDNKSAFDVMNNVRDNCQLPLTQKFLMLTLATYASADGICWPGNKKLREATGLSERTIRRMLRQLKSEGELEILTPGGGRGQKRILQLKRYIANPATAMATLTRPASLGKVSQNLHIEQPAKQKPTKNGRSTRIDSDSTLADKLAEHYLKNRISVRVPSEAIRQPLTRLERAGKGFE